MVSCYYTGDLTCYYYDCHNGSLYKYSISILPGRHEDAKSMIQVEKVCELKPTQ